MKRCDAGDDDERDAEGEGVLMSCMHGHSRMTVDPRTPIQCRDGARRVFMYGGPNKRDNPG